MVFALKKENFSVVKLLIKDLNMKKIIILMILYGSFIFFPYFNVSYSADYMVNINTADREQLKSLKGIGSKKAESILLDRKKKGVFHAISDLSRIDGFGDNFIKRLIKNNPGRISVGEMKIKPSTIKNSKPIKLRKEQATSK